MTHRIRNRWQYAFLAAALALGGCTQTIKPPPPEALAGSPVPFDELPPAVRGDVVDIIFATDRKPEVDAYEREIFGTSRSTILRWGSAEVRLSVGDGYEDLVAWTESRPDARPGNLKAEFLSFEELGRFPETPYLYRLDDTGAPVLESEVAREVEAAHEVASAEVRRRLRVGSTSTVHIYVHGIQTSFEGWMVDIARAWHLTGRLSLPIAYSWPAGGGGLLSGYAYDRESGEFTIAHLKQVIESVSAMPEVEQVNVFAHSRGTDVAVTAIRELFIAARAAGESPRERFKIQNLVLMAPDLDLEVLIQRTGTTGIGRDVGRITVYANANDEAIGAAQALFNSRVRLGNIRRDQLTERQRELVRRASNVDFVIYTGTRAGSFGHGYFRNSAILGDALLLTRDGREPGAENGRPLEPAGSHFWKIDDDYLR